MYIVQMDLKNGLVSIDSKPIVVDEKGTFAGAIEKLCSPPIRTDEGHARYDLLRKVSVSGSSADVIIDTGERKVFSITFLFDRIEFFTSSILESKY